MHLLHKSLLASAVAMVALWTNLCNGDFILRYMSIVRDTGYAKNCGDPSHPFTFSWSPKVLSAGLPMDLAVDYSSPYALNGGTYNLTLTRHGDTNPYLAFASPFSCDDVKGYIVCPVSKGMHVKTKKRIENTKFLKSVPDDRYILRAELKNEKGQQMICAELDVQVKNN